MNTSMNALSILYVIETKLKGDYVLGSESLQETSNFNGISGSGEGLHSALSDRFSLDTQVEEHNSATLSGSEEQVSVPRLLSDIGILLDPSGGEYPFPHFLKAVQYLKCILEACFDSFKSFHKLPLKTLLSPLATMEHWRLEDFEKNCKYSLCYPMAFLCSKDTDNLPELPSDFKPGLSSALLFKGRALQYLKSRISGRGGKEIFRWANTMLQGAKRGCLTVSSYFQVNTMLKHRAVLSKPAPITDDLQDFSRFCKERVKIPHISDKFWLREVSTSACSTRSVKEGGAREQVRKRLKEPGIILEPSLLKMDYSPNSGVIQIKSVIMPKKPREILRELAPKVEIINHDYPEPLPLCSAKVAAVLEPLKCRLITAGTAEPYYLSRGYQKDLWSAINRFPQFVATKRPINSFDIQNLLAREREIEFEVPMDFWVSGDYSAATDNVNMWYTKVTFEHCLSNSQFQNLSEEETSLYKEILRSVLYEHEISYPMDPPRVAKLRQEFIDEMAHCGFSESDKIKGCLEIFDKASQLQPFIQSNGQLMGSTLSFPILCLINLIQYWRSLEVYTGRTFELNQLPVLVNGDDILFRSNKNHYDLWKVYTAKAGFSLSIGKNYTHPNFFCINSQSYWEKDGEIEEIPYFNIGLLMGKSKGNNKKGGVSDFSGLSLDAMYNEMLDGSSNPIRATKRFLHYNRANVRKVTQNGLYNLYIPRVLGGCGFKPCDGVDYDVTSYQHAVCLDSFESLQELEGSTPNLRSKADPFIKIERTRIPTLRNGDVQWRIAPFGPLQEGQNEQTQSTVDLWTSLSTSCPTDFSITRDFALHKTIKNLATLFEKYKLAGGKPIRKGIRDRFYNVRLVTRSDSERSVEGINQLMSEKFAAYDLDSSDYLLRSVDDQSKKDLESLISDLCTRFHSFFAEENSSIQIGSD